MVVAESGYQTLEKPHRDASIMSEGKGFVLGLDIGKDRDHSVVAIVERVWESSIKRPYVNVVRYLDQYPLETHYRDVVADVMDRFIRSGFLTLPEEEYLPTVGARRTEPLLIIDATGIGDDVADRFLEAGLERRNLKRVVITGGLSETKPKAKYGVPKSRLLEAFRGAANFDTLKVASGTPLLDQLRKQIPNIKPKERADNRALTYEEIREAVHDDIVIAAALGHWGANKFFPIASRPVDLPPEFRAAGSGRTPRSKRRGWYL